MKKLSMLFISLSLLFLFSVSSDTNGGNSVSQLALSPSSMQAGHPIQPPV